MIEFDKIYDRNLLLCRDYSSIIEWAIKKIPYLTDKWNDFTVSDMGVILLNDIAYIYDNLNSILDKKFLNNMAIDSTSKNFMIDLYNLLGYDVGMCKSCRVPLKFVVSSNINGDILIPENTRFKTTGLDKTLYFNTVEGCFIDARDLNGCSVDAIEGVKNSVIINSKDIPKDYIILNSSKVASNCTRLESKYGRWTEVDDVVLDNSGNLVYSVHNNDKDTTRLKLGFGWRDLNDAARTVESKEFLNRDLEIGPNYTIVADTESVFYAKPDGTGKLYGTNISSVIGVRERIVLADGRSTWKDATVGSFTSTYVQLGGVYDSNNYFEVKYVPTIAAESYVPPVVDYVYTKNDGSDVEVFGGSVSPIPSTGTTDLNSLVIKGQTLKNELNYTSSTWAEWGKVGATADSTGLLLTSTGTGTVYVTLNNLSLKSNTKYGVLYYVVSSTLTQNFYFGTWNATRAFPTTVAIKTVGNAKIVVTTSNPITANSIEFSTVGTGEPAGNTIKFKDIRIFELPSGSQIESDFTNLTANQLAVKYPYIKGDSLKSAVSPKIRSLGKNLYKKTGTITTVQNGVTVSYDNVAQEYTLNGTTTAVANIVLSLNMPIPWILGDTYTFSRYLTSGTITLTSTAYLLWSIFNMDDTLYTSRISESSGNVNSSKLSVADVAIAQSNANNGYKVYIQCLNNSGIVFNNVKVKFQLEPGNVSSIFEPYKETSVYGMGILRRLPFNTCDISYPTNGKKIQNVGYGIFTGSENWTLYDTLTNTIRFKIDSTAINWFNNMGVINSASPSTWNYSCDKFIVHAIANDEDGISAHNSGGVSWIVINILKTKLSTQDLAGFKTWLASNNVFVQYPLATSITSYDTDTIPMVDEIVSQYEGVDLTATYFESSGSNGTIGYNTVLVPDEPIYDIYGNDVTNLITAYSDEGDAGVDAWDTNYCRKMISSVMSDMKTLVTDDDYKTCVDADSRVVDMIVNRDTANTVKLRYITEYGNETDEDKAEITGNITNYLDGKTIDNIVLDIDSVKNYRLNLVVTVYLKRTGVNISALEETINNAFRTYFDRKSNPSSYGVQKLTVINLIENCSNAISFVDVQFEDLKLEWDEIVLFEGLTINFSEA